MDALIIGLVVVNAALFAGLAIASVRVAWRERSPRIRWLAFATATVCAAFVVGGVQRLALQAQRLGFLSATTADQLLYEWQLVKSLVSLVFAVVAIWMARRALAGIRDVDHVVQVLTSRVSMKAAVSDLRLTPRELEVLDVIGSGALSDAEIAEELQISPHTAHTHVRNIMAKAEVTSRRDLLLLVRVEGHASRQPSRHARPG